MDIKKAETIIRKMPNINSVWFGCNYNEGFGFAASPNSKVVYSDPQVVFIIVDEDGNTDTMRFIPIDVSPSDLFYIDMKPSDLGRIQ